MVAVFFGNPYAAASVPDVPAMLLTYDFSDLAESSAVRRARRRGAHRREAADRAARAVPGRPRPDALSRPGLVPEFPRLLC